MKIKLIGAVILLSFAGPTWANETCTPAKDFVKLAKGFYGDRPELKNVISPSVNVFLKGINGYPTPTYLAYRYEGQESRLPIIKGAVQNIETAAAWPKDGELCRKFEERAKTDPDEKTTQMSISFIFPYQRQDGNFTIEEILEGAKDGSKIMKGLAPGGMGFAAPKLKTLVLGPSVKSEALPTYRFTRVGEPVDVPSYNLGQNQYIRIKDIKASKADAMTITGPYVLTAMFKIDPEGIKEAEAKRVAAAAKAETQADPQE